LDRANLREKRFVGTLGIYEQGKQESKKRKTGEAVLSASLGGMKHLTWERLGGKLGREGINHQISLTGPRAFEDGGAGRRSKSFLQKPVLRKMWGFGNPGKKNQS